MCWISRVDMRQARAPVYEIGPYGEALASLFSIKRRLA